MGTILTRSRGLGGSDHTSFNNAGLPGIGVNQDPIEYFTTTWHTNLDTYERIVPEDVKSLGNSDRGGGLPVGDEGRTAAEIRAERDAHTGSDTD